MARRVSSYGRPDDPADQPADVEPGKRELIVVGRPGAGLAAAARQGEGEVRARNLGIDLEGVTIRPLFGPSEERIRERLSELPNVEGVPDLTEFYHVDAPDERLDELAERLRESDAVEAAYVKPPGSPPIADDLKYRINEMAPTTEEPPARSPDFSARQIYLNAAPAGIDARFAWRLPGGGGAGVRIIDCEWGWRFGHEDLINAQGGVVIGSSDPDDNHGTAVLGEFGGDRNGFGIVGICPDAHTSGASFRTIPTASVIRQAADRLRAGDILLLEIHRAGPGASGVGQDGYVAIEWWPDDYAAIRYAVARGVVVVEAAGNGARNLDDAIYDVPATGFPASWRNPFNPANPSSGAVLVGAGAPPPGTHGRNHGPDRSRLEFSNYGRRVDAQGWGREVTTTGYGDLQGGANRDVWYTDQFSGTSSASPIVVGALGSMQGILRARHRPLLTPETARQLLRSTGSTQQDAPGRPRSQRIGNRPDLRQMIARMVGLPAESEGADDINGEQNGVALDGRSGRVVVNVNSPGVTISIGG